MTNAERPRSPCVCPGLDPRTATLVRLGALVALGAGTAYYRATVTSAMSEGVSVDEVIATLMAIAPTVGLARLVSATPSVALGLGYDVDAALESPDHDWSAADMNTASNPRPSAPA